MERVSQAKFVVLVVTMSRDVECARELASAIEGDQPPGHLCAVLYTIGQSTIDSLEPLLPHIDAVIAWAPFSASVVDKVLQSAPKVRWLHSRFAGIDLVVSLPVLQRSPAVMTLTNGVSDPILAEWAIAASLHFAKSLRRLQKASESRTWERFFVGELRGKTMGIVGYGGIGRAVSALARAFGMRVIGLKRTAGVAEDGVECVGSDGLLQLLSESDYVVLAMPLTAETRGMISEREFTAMKAGAVFVNVGRGPTVDETALVRALDEKRIAGAALDVCAVEPLPSESPLWGRDDVLISPHCANMTHSWVPEQLALARENTLHFVAGEPLKFIANKELGY